MDDADAVKKAAVAANGEAWALLEKPDRTAAEDEAMVAAAERSLALWDQVGTGVHRQRGHWLVARVATELERSELALTHAARTLELTAAHRPELADFDLAFTEEIAARALALAGDAERAAAHHAEARRLGAAIADEGDRREFFRQFRRGPWFGISPAAD